MDVNKFKEYIADRMSDEEKNRFTHELLTDKELAEDLDNFKLLHTTLSIERNREIVTNVQNKLKKEGFFKKNKFYLYFIILIIIAIIGCYIYYTSEKKESIAKLQNIALGTFEDEIARIESHGFIPNQKNCDTLYTLFMEHNYLGLIQISNRFNCSDTFSLYLLAHSLMQNKQFQTSKKTFSLLNDKVKGNFLRNNLAYDIAVCDYYLGNFDVAKQNLKNIENVSDNIRTRKNILLKLIH